MRAGPGALDDVAQQVQAAVEEVVGAGHTTPGRPSGCAQASTLARRTVSSSLPWITSVSAGTASVW